MTDHCPDEDQPCPDEGCPFTVEGLKSDVQAQFAAQADLDPGKFAAVNWSGLFGKLDGLVQKLAPVISLLTPPQYAAMVQLVLAALHGLHSGHEVAAPE